MDTENKSLQMAIEAIKQEGRKEILNTRNLNKTV
jgi:hypothetical protein